MYKRIIVADDDPAIVDSIAYILEDEGYIVEKTLDGGKVNKMFKSKPDLLLLDVWMSGQDGREICKLLKSQPETKNVPIIMVSANKDTEKIAREIGADDFLGKPFDIEDLLGKVKKQLQKSSTN